MARALRRRCRTTRASSSSTTPRPTAPARSPTGSRRRTRGSPSCTAPGKAGLGPGATSPASRTRSPHGAGAVVEMDCDFSHDPAVVPALLGALDDGADLALGSRYVPGGRVENWSAWRRAVSRGGCLYAQAVLRAPVRDLTGGFKAFRAEALHAIDYGTRAGEGLRVPGRADLPRAARRPAGDRGPDRLPRAPRGRVEDVGRDRARGGLARSGAAPPVPRRACRSDGEMNSEQLALVRGWADTRATLRAWQRAPAPRRRRLGGGEPRRRRAAARRDLGRRAAQRAGPVRCSP